MTKSKKHRLTLHEEIDHALLAIASHEKGYHLAWTLNKEVGMHLVRAGEYRITRKKQNVSQSFPLFRWNDQTRMVTYHLVANRSESGILIPKLKNIDFFLHLSPTPEETFLNKLLQQLVTLPVIITAFQINPADHPLLADMIFE